MVHDGGIVVGDPSTGIHINHGVFLHRWLEEDDGGSIGFVRVAPSPIGAPQTSGCLPCRFTHHGLDPTTGVDQYQTRYTPPPSTQEEMIYSPTTASSWCWSVWRGWCGVKKVRNCWSPHTVEESSRVIGNT